MACTATRSNGDPCPCAGYAKRDKDSKCFCRHKQEEHKHPQPHESKPEPSLGSILDRFAAKTNGLRPKATPSHARHETNAGFRDVSSTKKKQHSSKVGGWLSSEVSI